MSDEQLYCDVPGCQDPNDPSFPRPAFRNGKCSSHMKQLQRTGKTAPIAERKSPKERLIDLGTEWLNETEDDDRDNDLFARFIAAAKGLPEPDSEVTAIIEKVHAEARRRRAAAARRGLDRARKAGRRIGRPPKGAPTDITEWVRGVYAETRSVSATARALGLDRKTVRARLRLGRNTRVFPHPAESPA